MPRRPNAGGIYEIGSSGLSAAVAPRLALTLAVLMGPVAAAQGQTAPARPVTGQAELSFVATAGNSDTQTLGVGGEVEYAADGWTANAKANFVTASANDTVTARTWVAQLGAARQLSTRLEAFGQMEHVKNRLAGILNRYASEGGLGFSVWPGAPTHQLRFRAGSGFTHESRAQTTAGNDAGATFVTANYGARYRWRFSATAEIAAEGSLTHNLEATVDWRANSTVSLSAELTSILSMKLSSRLAYLNRPVPGFGRHDVVTSAALVGRF